MDTVISVDPAGHFSAGLLKMVVLLAAVACAAAPIEGQGKTQLKAQIVPAAAENVYYARRNTFGIFAAYSWDSSHILLGYAENRRLLNLGVSYSRRLLLNRIVNWQYDGELMPVTLESDPVQTTTTTVNNGDPTLSFSSTVSDPTMLACQPASGSGTFPNGDTYTDTSTCGRRWVAGEAMSPVGFQWDFLPQRRLQPFVDGHGGFMYSAHQVPVDYAGSFNFTFDFGAGFEYFRSPRRSIRAEYRYHHLSNHNTALENPGVDSGLLQVSYCFGR